MGELSPRFSANIGRRAISAVRDFPKGCGIKVSPKPNPNPPPVVELVGSRAKEADADVASEASSSLKPPIAESRDSSQNLEAGHEQGLAESGVKLESLGVEINGHLEKLVTENGGKSEASVKVNGRVEEEASCSRKCVNGDVKEEACNLKKSVVIKRRRVSAVRDFPANCGRAGAKVSRKADSGAGPVASSESKAFDNEKKVGDEMRMNGDADKEKVMDEAEKRGEKVAEKVRESENRVPPAGKLAHEAKTDRSKQIKVEVEEVSSKTAIKSPKGKSCDGGQPLVKGKETLEYAHSASSAEMGEDEYRQVHVIKSPDVKTSEGKKKIAGVSPAEKLAGKDESKKIDVKVKYESPTLKDVEGKMKLPKKQKESMEGSGSASSVDSETGGGKIEAKKSIQNAQESSSEVRFKSPLNRSSSERVLEDHGEKKSAIHSTPNKKLAGQAAKKTVSNLQRKEQREAKASLGVKTTDEIGRNFVGKLIHKTYGGTSEDSVNLKRRRAEEEGDESLEAYADKVIVQALMSAENCPWRKGKKPGSIPPRSITPKFNAKRARKVVGSRSTTTFSGRASSSLHNDILDVEDEDDSLPQDGKNETALTFHNSSRELCITMTPCVPSEVVRNGATSDEATSRNMVKRTLRLYQLICRKLVQEEESSKGKPLRRQEANTKDAGKSQRVDLRASRLLKDNNQWVNHGEPIIGHVPGVEVGDEFHYRVELSIIGLHRPFQGGIDFTKKDGMVLAMSIVASGGYPDDIDSSDVLIYSGSGGTGGGDKEAGDQKLERGNLALKNSIDAQTPVRVIYGSKELVKSESLDTRAKMVATFTYDGLYMVEKYWPERSNNGYNVFKFQLRRMPGQPEIALKEIKKTKKSKIREGLCVKDISDGKERLPICAVNTADNDLPMPFKYLTKVMYPSWYVQKLPRGCDCTDGCSDSGRCACAVKNGGEIPFNFNGAIVQAKPLIFECGPSCKCPPSCHNRVSQHGIRLPLEIFKTKSRGWGVRSLYSIPSGTFVCEYVGEMLEDTQAEQRTNDEYLFDIGHNYDDHTLWEGLPGFVPGALMDAASETQPELKDDGFTIDAAEYGNVGRFINHSCSPNLYAQNVLYDHDDKKMPHVMFFAVDNIPPLQELTYHYNYTIDQVRDSEGNIKKKECFCGSPECTGRLY